jgi:hypothetical protein
MDICKQGIKLSCCTFGAKYSTSLEVFIFARWTVLLTDSYLPTYFLRIIKCYWSRTDILQPTVIQTYGTTVSLSLRMTSSRLVAGGVVWFKASPHSFTGAYSPGWTFGLPFGVSVITHIPTHGRNPLDQWYSTFFVRVPPDIISLQLCTPKVVGT